MTLIITVRGIPYRYVWVGTARELLNSILSTEQLVAIRISFFSVNRNKPEGLLQWEQAHLAMHNIGIF